MAQMKRSRFQFGIRHLLAVTAWCAVGLGVIKWQPEICHAAPVVVAVACLAIAWECTRYIRTKRWAIAFLVAMAVQLVSWFVFIGCLRILWYVVLYCPVLAFYDELGLVPRARFAETPIMVIEVPIVGATVYSLIVAAIVPFYAKDPPPAIREESKRAPGE
jgi:hypothetical protein